MADLDKTDTDAKKQLFDQLDELHAGMLGLEGSSQHLQPMNPNFDREAGKIWFITSRQSDLVGALNGAAPAIFTFVGKRHDYYADMRGTLSVVQDEAMLDRIWSAVAAAWFDDGRRDPDVTLLCLDLKSAGVWANDGNPIHFGLEIIKANMDRERKPHVGKRVELTF